MASEKNVEPNFRRQGANGGNVSPSDQGRMAAPALISRNENGISSVRPAFPKKLLNNSGLQDRIIGGNQEPALLGSRMKPVLQPSQPLFHRRSHSVRGFRR